MENKRVTIADIADELGLSTATVSNVIHGRRGKASPETIRRVQQLLSERQYIPNMAGILLARNDSKIIGVMINNHDKYERRLLQDPFISAAVNYLSEEIDRSGNFMMIKATNDCRDIVEFASMWNMVGVIVIGFCAEDYEYLRGQLRIPMVVYDGYQSGNHSYANVTIDDFDGGRQVGEYLASRGHSKILCMADNDVCMDDMRYEGLRRALERYGASSDRMIVPMRKDERDSYYVSNFDKIMSYSAVFAVSDVYAVELMMFLQSRGVSIPRDISVVGYDDSIISTMTSPKLTTVRQDNQIRAWVAVEMLLRLREKPDEFTNSVLPVQLIERESVRDLQLPQK